MITPEPRTIVITGASDGIGAAAAVQLSGAGHRVVVVGRSPVALGLAKRLLYRNSAAADPLEAHLSDSLAMFWTSIGDGKEGVAAFLEKRPPRFTGSASDLPDVF